MNKKIISLVVFTLMAVQSFSLLAEPSKYRGQVLKFNGDVEIVDVKGGRRVVKKINEPLNEMDTIVTKKGARIVVQFDDGALSFLDEKSRLRVEKTSWFSYLGGKVYFTFKKVFGEPRNVRTRAATIGVRGTTFIIAENKTGESIALREGALQIKSNGALFEVHKKKIMDEFNQFKQQYQQAQKNIKNEFEQYKKHTAGEFIEYRQQFSMQANQVIMLSGYRVDESIMNEKNKKDFESFESEAEERIKQFRLESKEHIAE
jgi:CHASE3 domain sensor protein